MSQLSQLLRGHTDKHGVSLYEHLNQLLFQITSDAKFGKDLENFELMSDFLKKNRYVYSQPPSDKDVNQVQEKQPSYAEWARLVNELLKANGQAPVPTILQNFVNDARALEIAGYGFSEEESYNIQLSLKRLAIETKAKELYFWGKYLTNGKDYYVARGITPPLPSDQLPINGEPRGTGVNYYTFWVTHDVLTDWQELPLITPQQVAASRLIKHICTGDLNAQLSTYPPFPGKEKHYLKAQIVRITHANVIVPKGLYKPNDEDAKIVEFEEEFKLPEFAELAVLDNWVHLPPQILKLGRITHWVDPTLSEEAKQTKQDELNEFDGEIERLKSLQDDKPYEPFYETNWQVKSVGDLQVYNPAKDDGTAGVYGVTVLRNYLWPGALTVAYRSSFVNLYVGYGLKLIQSSFEPIAPNDLQEEPEEVDEHHEPNPKNPPKPPQVDPVVDPVDLDPQD